MKNDNGIDIKLGTLISATHRKQDLLPAFLEAIRAYAPAEYAQMVVAPFGPIPAWVYDEGDDCEWWDSEIAAFRLEEMFDVLNDHAPEGYYFGAHEGDGSDFGFWEIRDEDVA